MKVRLEMRPAQHIVDRLGLAGDGDAQRWWTHEVHRRMLRYMPYRTGTTSGRLTYQRSPTQLETAAPYARMLYNGVAPSGKAIKYTKEHNPEAGPFWDRRLMAAEGKQMAKDLQRYVKYRRGSH